MNMYKVIESHIKDCFEIRMKEFEDNRGVIRKTFHKNFMRKIGINHNFYEDLIVKSKKNVLRGMHFQKKPYEQAKLIYCVKGKILDVALDLRIDSKTFGKFEVFELDSKKGNMAFIPEGFAHGYLVIEDDTIVNYKMSNRYEPRYEGGIRWDSINVPWPIENPIVSEKDSNLPLFKNFIRKL